jgi:hypothetical protein
VSSETNNQTGETFDLNLTVEDTAAQKLRVAPGKVRLASGYNPYDAVVPLRQNDAKAKEEEKRKPTDLRKLSEWIRMQRQIEALKKEKFE